MSAVAAALSCPFLCLFSGLFLVNTDPPTSSQESPRERVEPGLGVSGNGYQRVGGLRQETGWML